MLIGNYEVISLFGRSLNYRKKGEFKVRETNSCSDYHHFSELIQEILEDN